MIPSFCHCFHEHLESCMHIYVFTASAGFIKAFMHDSGICLNYLNLTPRCLLHYSNLIFSRYLHYLKNIYLVATSVYNQPATAITILSASYVGLHDIWSQPAFGMTHVCLHQGGHCRQGAQLSMTLHLEHSWTDSL